MRLLFNWLIGIHIHISRHLRGLNKTVAMPDFFCLKCYSFLFLALIKFSDMFAGSQNDPAGARSAGLANASVTLQDGWSCFNNQAGLGYLEKIQTGFFFENRYNIKEFSTKAAFFAVPVSPGTFAITYKYFGYSKYYESKLGLAFGRKLFKKFSAGIQLNYLHTHIAGDYENLNTVVAEVGLLSEPLDNLFIGFHLFNPSQSNPGNLIVNSLTTTVKFGVSYLIEKKVLLTVETVKDTYVQPLFHMGIELFAIDKLSARIGFTTIVNQMSLGLGYSMKKITADISFTNNQLLGYSPQASVVIGF